MQLLLDFHTTCMPVAYSFFTVYLFYTLKIPKFTPSNWYRIWLLTFNRFSFVSDDCLHSMRFICVELIFLWIDSLEKTIINCRVRLKFWSYEQYFSAQSNLPKLPARKKFIWNCWGHARCEFCLKTPERNCLTCATAESIRFA